MPSAARPRPSLASFEVATAAVPPVDDRVVHQVAVGAIRVSGRNPRAQLPNVDELADSLREHGLLQPIVVRRAGAGYELIAGHRRLEAWKRLGRAEIAAVVRQETDVHAYVLMLVENLQREDLEPHEEAAALLELERQLGSAAAVARAIKRSEAYVSKRKRVYQDVVLAPAVLERGLPVTTAEELLVVQDVTDRHELAERARAEAWDRPTVRATARTFAAKGAASGPGEAPTAMPGSAGRSRAIVRQVQELRRSLDAGPLASLSADAAHELRIFARDLVDRLAQLPL